MHFLYLVLEKASLPRTPPPKDTSSENFKSVAISLEHKAGHSLVLKWICSVSMKTVRGEVGPCWLRATEAELPLGCEVRATCWVACTKSEMTVQLPMFFDFWKLSSLIHIPAFSPTPTQPAPFGTSPGSPWAPQTSHVLTVISVLVTNCPWPSWEDLSFFTLALSSLSLNFSVFSTGAPAFLFGKIFIKKKNPVHRLKALWNFTQSSSLSAGINCCLHW